MSSIRNQIQLTRQPSYGLVTDSESVTEIRNQLQGSVVFVTSNARFCHFVNKRADWLITKSALVEPDQRWTASTGPEKI